jgi:hypothetical protein
VFVQEVDDVRYIEVQVLHDLAEEGGLGFCKGDEKVLNAEVVVLTLLALLDRRVKQLHR